MREYKVLEIVDAFTLLIDYGFNNGAKKGDTLRIIEKGKPVIVDGNDYGTLDTVKDVVEVDTPYDKFSVCRKAIYKTENPLNPLTSFEKTMRVLRPLNIEPIEVSHRELPTPPSPIKKGDLAILTNE